MSIVRKIKRMLRGEVAATTAARELLRRSRVRLNRKRERARLSKWQERTAQLQPEFAKLPGAELLKHFRNRSVPAFFPGFSLKVGEQQESLFPAETKKLITQANKIVDDHIWSLLGLGERSFGEQVDWHLDPVSKYHWPLDYHGDINLFSNDGSDVRVVWELNRLSHSLTLARAYAVTHDERFAAEFLDQLDSWHSQNPYGMGANWNCAMEVALRATNLLAAFEIFRHSSLLDEDRLRRLLAMFDQHGAFIRENLEFSYVATSNHYLSDVVGLVWLGTMLPELESASNWRDFGLREMLREMDKQVLADGADFESSTGYHRFVLEMFLYTFIVCRANSIEIAGKYWGKLRQMIYYVRAYLRPDGRAPLIGDSDSGQFFPISKRAGDDHAYLLPLGAVVFEDANLKDQHAATPEELLWILGEEGVSKYRELKAAESGTASQSFTDAGIYVLRDGDLYLLLNATGAGINGRGSHGHNDALSVEVSACGRPFIVDPGTYVYTADLEERHRFRSTAYHSTMEIDSVEQNTTHKETPFVIGNESRPLVIEWDSNPNRDVIAAEHYGYTRLNQPVTHRRFITFEKQERWWLVKDELSATGNHELSVRFHLAEGLEVEIVDDRGVRAYDKISGASLMIVAIDVESRPELEMQFMSRDYLAKSERAVACWRIQTQGSSVFRWVILPVCAGEDSDQRFNAIINSADLGF